MFQLNFLADAYQKPDFKLESLFALLIFFFIVITCLFVAKKTSATYGFLTFLFISFLLAGTHNVLVILQNNIDSLSENEVFGAILTGFYDYTYYEVFFSNSLLELIRSALPDDNEVTKGIGEFLNNYSCSVYFGYILIWLLATLLQKSKNKKKSAKIEF